MSAWIWFGLFVATMGIVVLALRAGAVDRTKVDQALRDALNSITAKIKRLFSRDA